MHRAPSPDDARTGFTLLEILVALVLIGLLAGTIVPAVLNQLSKGEINRVVEDLAALGTAAKSYRADVQRWPGDLEDLVSRPSGADDTPLGGGSYPTGLVTRWKGPYLEVGTIPGDTLPTSLGGVILGAMDTTMWGGQAFLTLHVRNISEDDARAISTVVDGDSVIAHGDGAGRVRWREDGGSELMSYLVGPTH